MFKINNSNTKFLCWKYSKLIITTLNDINWLPNGFFLVTFEQTFFMNLEYLFVTRFSPLLHFIMKPVIWFAQQIKWLVSIWNATLGWDGFSSNILECQCSCTKKNFRRTIGVVWMHLLITKGKIELSFCICIVGFHDPLNRSK